MFGGSRAQRCTHPLYTKPSMPRLQFHPFPAAFVRLLKLPSCFCFILLNMVRAAWRPHSNRCLPHYRAILITEKMLILEVHIKLLKEKLHEKKKRDYLSEMSSNWAVREMTPPRNLPPCSCYDGTGNNRRSCVITSVHFFKNGHRLQLYLPPFTSPSCIHFSPPISLFCFISLKKRVHGGGWGIVQADSIRLCDWVAGIPWGHEKVKEFSGTNMIMVL